MLTGTSKVLKNAYKVDSLMLVGTCKSEKVPAKYMLMLTGTSKV